MRAIRTTFRQLARSFGRIAPIFTAVPQARTAAPTAGEKQIRRKPRLTLATRAALKLQGRYMGTMRGLPATKRAIVKKVRAEKGIRAAIVAARRMSA
ncbi:MAG TPA: hypothetical protein VGK94_15485 [Candidatus Polarisedimenticolia bacterium]|jgi:hypothetical protein